MTIYLWSIFVSICVVSIEIMYTKSSYWTEYWYIVFPLMFVGNLGIYSVIHGSMSLISAFVIISAGSFFARIAYSVYAGYEISNRMWVATTLVGIAMVLRWLDQ